MMKRTIAILVAGMSVAAATNAQVCKDTSIQQTTDPDQFVVHGDGAVTDAETGLMWTTCSVGQSYSNGSCKGSASSMSWTQALQQAQIINGAGGIAGQSDWRLPNIKELGSLVEFQCHSPAINLSVFPDTPSGTYWSSTPDIRDGKQARSIYFVDGSDLTPDVSSGRYIRLVRDR